MKTLSVRRSTFRRTQQGVTLVMALIMLTALGLFAVGAFNSSTISLRMVGNTQSRQEAFAAVQTAIESTISSAAFMNDPVAVAASPIPVDVAGNDSATYTALLVPAPACYRVHPVPVGELDPTLSSDLPCLLSQRPSGIVTAVPGSAAGSSLCADMEWNVRAVVNDPTTSTKVAVNQGIATRGLVTDAATGCP